MNKCESCGKEGKLMRGMIEDYTTYPITKTVRSYCERCLGIMTGGITVFHKYSDELINKK